VFVRCERSRWNTRVQNNFGSLVQFMWCNRGLKKQQVSKRSRVMLRQGAWLEEEEDQSAMCGVRDPDYHPDHYVLGPSKWNKSHLSFRYSYCSLRTNVFLPRDALLTRCFALCPCPSVSVSVTSRNSIKTDERIKSFFGQNSFLRPVIYCLLRKLGYLQK